MWILDSAQAAQQRPVRVERTAGGMSVIASGLREGERVITDGQSRLTPGAPVEVRSAADTAGGGGGGRKGGGKGGGKAGATAAGKGTPAP